MNTKRRFYKILLTCFVLLLLSGVMFACAPDNAGGGDSVVVVTPVEKSVILANLADNLDGSIARLDTAKNSGGIVSIHSNYAFMAEDLKYNIVYNANYDYGTPTGARSEIYLKVFDDEFNKTRLMFNYINGTLYMEADGERNKIENFGSSGMFNIFYSFVTYFDMSSIILNRDFASSVEDLDSYLDSKKIGQLDVTETRKNIFIKNVNFDTYRGTVNNLITDGFGRFGTTYDAAATQLLGVSLSRLAGMQVMNLDANLVEFYSENGVFDETSFDFSGRLESRYEFSLVGGFSVVTERRGLDVDNWDDEAKLATTIEEYCLKNNSGDIIKNSLIEQYSYKNLDLTRRSYDGVLKINLLGNEYDAKLFYDVDTERDEASKISFTLFDQDESAAGLYYKDSRLYVDLGDLYSTFNNAFGLSAYNFPRAYTTTFSLSEMLDGIYDTLDILVRDAQTSSAEQRSGLWDITREKLVSNGTVMTLYIDKKFVEALNEIREVPFTNANVAALIADLIGFDDTTITQYFSGDVFDTLRLLVSFDVADGTWTLLLQNTATEADALHVTSVDEDESLYDQIGTVSAVNSLLTANGVNYYFYHYQGNLYTTKQRSIVAGEFRGDLQSLQVTVDGVTTGYLFGENKGFGVVELTDAGGVVVGRYYTAQGYLTLGEGEQAKTYYFSKTAPPTELYSDEARTTVVNNINFAKYMFKVENMYYYIGGSAVYYLGYLSAGTFDVFTQTFSVSQVKYNYGNGVIWRTETPAGVLSSAGLFVITREDASTPWVYATRTLSDGRTALYLNTDTEQRTVGYYHETLRAIEFISGTLEGNFYFIDVDNNLMRGYGTIDFEQSQVVVNDYTYNLNFGGVYSTQEGIDDVVTLQMSPIEEIRDLYSIIGQGSMQAYSLSLGGTTYYYALDKSGVYTDSACLNAVAGASFQKAKKQVIIDGVAYKLSATAILQGTETVGYLDTIDGLIELNGITYHYDAAGRVYDGAERGTVGVGTLTVGEVEYAIISNEIFTTETPAVKVGDYTAGLYVFNAGETLFDDGTGTLYALHGAIDIAARSITLDGDAYTIAQNSAVYLVSGRYYLDNQYIELNGVRYFVKDGKVYTDSGYTAQVGSADEATGTITIDGIGSFYYDNVSIEVSRNVYQEIAYPETMGFTFNGTVTLGQVNSLDVSKFLGAFIGDSQGVNTPYTLLLGESIRYTVKMAYYDDIPKAYIELNHYAADGSLIRRLMKVASATDGTEDLLITYNVMSTEFKFRTTTQQILDALKEFSGADSIFAEEDLTNALYLIFDYASTSFTEDGIAYQIVYDTANSFDPLYELFGLRYLSTTGLFVVDYELEIPEIDEVNADIANYEVPIINLPDRVIAESIHDVNWIETVPVTLGGRTFDVIIPYIESSVTIADNKTVYTPTASIFGKTVSYSLVLSDAENGTKAVIDINEGEIVIDPWSARPIPDKIGVVYADGTTGYLDYEIVGFDRNGITEYGNALWNAALMTEEYPTYTVVISRGRIGEITLTDVRVRVVCRLLASTYTTTGTTKVVAEATIDPYDYDEKAAQIEKSDMQLASTNNSSASLTNTAERFYVSWESGVPQLYSYVTLRFYSYYTLDNHSLTRSEKLIVKWDFDFSAISYRGGEYVARASKVIAENGEEYATPDIAVTVRVSTKVIAHISMYNIATGADNPAGTYMVDSLDASTYVIPGRSTDSYMILVYYTDGRFRVLGSTLILQYYQEEGLIVSSSCDGVYDTTLDWTYGEATYISEYGSPAPLDGGRESVDTASITSSFVGDQIVYLTVTEPSRIVETTGSVSGYTRVSIVNGLVSRTFNTFAYNTVDWGSGMNMFYEINPYKIEALPMQITVAVNIARGSSTPIIEERTYPIQRWDTASNVIKESNGSYFLQYPTSAAAYFEAKVYIGDGSVSLPVTVVLSNINAEYSYYEFDGQGRKESGETTTIEVNAFSPYELPENFTIVLDDGTEQTYNFGNGDGMYKWYIDYGTQEAITIEKYRQDFVPAARAYTLWSAETYAAFSAFVNNGEGVYNSAWTDSKYYFFDNVSSEITLTAYIPSGVDGSLEQKIELIVSVVEMSAFTVSDEVFPNQNADNSIVSIDTYDALSARLVGLLRFNAEDGGFVSVLPIKMYSTAKQSYYTYYQKLDWSDPLAFAALLDALSAAGQTTNDIAVSGVTQLGGGTLDVTFRCADRLVSNAANFYFRAMATVNSDMMTTSYSLDGVGAKSLAILLKQPYALKTTKAGAASATYALPSQYFAAALANLFVAFDSGVYGNYATDIDRVIRDGVFLVGGDGVSTVDFDSAVLDFSVADTNTQVYFYLRVGEGSAQDSIYVELETAFDTVQTVTRSVIVEIYNNDGIGGLRYENGYTVPTTYNVTYTKSGLVTYEDIIWTLASPTEVPGGTLQAGTVLTSIPAAYIGNEGKTYGLEGMLPDGSRVQRNITISAKNVGVTAYDATGYNNGTAETTAAVSAESAVIRLDNIYQLYDILAAPIGGRQLLDITKLPNVLLPQISDLYSDNGNPPIRFRVDWNLGTLFYVDEAGAIHSTASETREGVTYYKVATADIQGYANTTQSVELYLTIAASTPVSVTAEGYDFRYDEIAGKQYLYIDPYKEYTVDGQRYYIWETTLPTALTLTLADGTHEFTDGAQIVYRYGALGAMTDISKLTYNYSAFVNVGGGLSTLGGVKLTLPDNRTLDVDIVLIDRTYQSVELEYTTYDGSQFGTAYFSDVYYIDPYNEATHTVPTSVRVVYAGGDNSTLNVNWSVFTDSARTLELEGDINLAHTGASYYYRAVLNAYRYDEQGRLVLVGQADNQNVDVTVNVLDRRLENDALGSVYTATGIVAAVSGTDFRIDRSFVVENGEDYIGARLSDIYARDLTQVDFTPLPQAIATGAYADMYLVYPNIVWDSEFSDDSITGGMNGSVAITGKLGGSAGGQLVKAYLTTDKLTLIDFDATTVDVTSQGVALLWFNPYSLDTKDSSYGFVFGVERWDGTAWVAAANTGITFNTEFTASEDAGLNRHLIYWKEIVAGQTAVFELGNATKSALTRVGSDGVSSSCVFLNATYLRLDLGLGATDNVGGNAKHVIDPLAPYLPSIVQGAEGYFEIGSTVGKTTIELDALVAQGYIIIDNGYGKWLPLGSVNISWNGNPLANLSYTTLYSRQINAVVSSQQVATNLPITFTMWYLDRNPVAVLTTERGYGVTSGTYPGYNDLTTSSGVSIDPIENYNDGYKLMSSVTLRFNYTYSLANPEEDLFAKAVDYYGRAVMIDGIAFGDWSIESPGISLAGTASSITASLVRASVSGAERNYALTIPVNVYTVELNVTARTVTQTSITQAFDAGSHNLTVRTGENAVDPFNITFPKSFTVTFGVGNASDTRTYGWSDSYSELWTITPETAERLNNPEVINGTRPSLMHLVAYITICGENYYFTFEILPRPISVADEGNNNTIVRDNKTLIVGGTIHIKQTARREDAISQLPTSMYYDFDYPNKNFVEVPITWNEADMVNLNQVGTIENVRAMIGKTFDDEWNIVFNITVVDTKLYEIRTLTDALGNVTEYGLYDLVYDKYIVSVGSSGAQLTDIDADWMPRYIRLDASTYLAVESTRFDLAGNKAYLTCKYEFAGNNENTTLAGTADGQKLFDFTYEVALLTNDITGYVETATLTADSISFGLGEDLDLTAFPKAVYGEHEYYVFWDVTGRLGGDIVDKYKAGTYSIFGQVLNGLREVVTFSLTVVIEKIDVSGLLYIETNNLNYNYTGIRVGDWQAKLNWPDGMVFLDTDGRSYSPEALFEFSTDGINWIRNEFIDCGRYYLRVSIDDDNVVGSKVFDINISPAVINGNYITFAGLEVAYNGRAQQPTVLYYGEPLSDNVGYYFDFYRYIGNVKVYYPSGAINASEADGYGNYFAELKFRDNDNYDFSAALNKEAPFVIRRKTAGFSLVESEVYNGSLRHISINNLPSTWASEGIRISYTYTYTNAQGRTITTSNMIKDVGTYRVSVRIDGGTNYYNNDGSNIATLTMAQYRITQAPLTVRVEDIVCTYPDVLPLVPNVVYTGIVGADAMIEVSELLGTLIITSQVTEFVVPSPGEYAITASGLFSTNYDIDYISGVYSVRLDEGVQTLEQVGYPTRTLQEIIDAASGSLKIYLPAANYGSLVIDNSDLALSLIGECNADGTYATLFSSITLLRGSLSLDTVGFMAEVNITSISVKATASDLLIRNTGFYGVGYTTESVAAGSVAINAETGYSGQITCNSVRISWRAVAINTYGGSLTIGDSLIENCAAGIAVRGGSITMINSTLTHCTTYALYLADVSSTFELNNNTLANNVVGIRYNVRIALTSNASVVNGNTYNNNQSNMMAQE